MKIYLFKNFNNYYNREITRFNTINEYIENDLLKNNYAVRSTGNPIDSTENGKIVNFAEHDGLRTELTYNYDPNQDWVPSYVIVDDIQSRWFVIDYYKNRKGQYKLYLKRDTISDFKRLLTNSKAYIERASYLANPYPLIYNKDSDSFNEIKQNEYLLTDDTKLNWYVIYMPNIDSEKSISVPFTNSDMYVDSTYNTLDDIPYYTDSINGNYIGLRDNIHGNYYLSVDGVKIEYYTTNNKFVLKEGTDSNNIVSSLNTMSLNDKTNFITLMNKNKIDEKNVVLTNYNEYIKTTNRVIYAAGNYYKQTSSLTITTGDNEKVTKSDNADLYNLIRKYYIFTSCYMYKKWYLVITNIDKLNINTYKMTLNSAIRYINGMPYKAIVLPHANRFVNSNITKLKLNNIEYEFNSNVSELLVNKLVETLKGSDFIYDVQLFPYCPIPHTVNNDIIEFNVQSPTAGIDFININNNSGNWSIALALPDANFSFNIANTFIEDKGLMNNKELKIEHQCESYRLCSPDSSSIYNLDILANGGVEYFNVDCTLKPYASYIHINPNFKYLNGIDTDDYRGLVIKSDFAIPMVSNNWETYVQNNVNYQKIFDRQIQNMDVTNDITNKRSYWNIAGGTLTGAASGAYIGSNIGHGNPIGIGVGAAVGGVASLGGGIADIYYQRQLQQENKSYAIDSYNLNLGNIKAQANTLSKVDNFDYNNKIFPYIEFYSCTDAEKEYYKNKIEVNGYNIDVITDDISKWYNDNDGLYANIYTNLQMNYLKCRLIKLNYNMTTDVLTNNILNDLAEELNKGVYI